VGQSPCPRAEQIGGSARVLLELLDHSL